MVEFGKGVYYFPFTRAVFANNLVKFLNIHTNLEVTAMTGDVVRQNELSTLRQSDYGAAAGYFVTFSEKK